MFRIVAAFVVAAALAGCAATYKAPKGTAPDVSTTLNKPAAQIFSAAQKALALNGYQIVSSDKAAGILSTAKRTMRLTPADADCGTTMGIDYLKDKRTVTRVAVNIVVAGQTVRAVATVEGEYLKGHTSQSIEMQCVSKGRIEQRVIAEIRRNAG